MSIEHEDWLARTKEDPIEPELPICDPHHHLWDQPDNRYLLEELFRDIGGGHNIVQTVFVESQSLKKKDEAQPIGETKFVHRVSNQNARWQYGKTKVAAGIVGFADLASGNAVNAVLRAQLAASDRFRGIRQIVSWHACDDVIFSPSQPRVLADKQFREGFACLQEYGLTFETFLYHTQLAELLDLAMVSPDTTIILEHIGGPIGIGPYEKKRDEVFREWQSSIAELATCPNVVIKLGGLGMPFCGFGWNKRTAPPDSAELAEAMAPYYLWCIEQFGAERCMFESNFPVDKESYSYTILWNAFKRISKGFSQEERAALFYNTAVKVYRL